MKTGFSRREQVVNAALTPIQLVRCRLGRHHTYRHHDPHGFRVACTHCSFRRPARADKELVIPDPSGAGTGGMK